MSAGPITDLFRVRDERKPGHHWADNEVLDLHGRDLGAYGYAVYMAMSRHASNTTGRCSRSVPELATIFAISRDTVDRAIAKLIELRLIAKESQPGKAATFVLLEVPKVRIVPRGQKNLPMSPPSADNRGSGDPNPPLTTEGVSAHSGGYDQLDTPLKTEGYPLTTEGVSAHSGGVSAENQGAIRKQDSYKTSTRLLSTQIPPTPLCKGGDANAQLIWQLVRTELREQIGAASTRVPRLANDYDKLFGATRAISVDWQERVLTIGAENPALTQLGLEKYGERIRRYTQYACDVELQVRIGGAQ